MPDYITNLAEGALGCLQALTGLAWLVFSLVWMVKCFMDGVHRSEGDWFWFLSNRGFYLGFLSWIPYSFAWALIAHFVGVLWLWCILAIQFLLAVLWLDGRNLRHPMDGKLSLCHPIAWPFWFALRRLEGLRRMDLESEIVSRKD